MLTTIVVGCLWAAVAVLLVALNYQCDVCGSASCKCRAA